MAEALLKKNEINKGTLVLPEGQHYLKEILAREDRVIQIMKSRYNFFIALFVGHITKFNEKSKFGQAWNVYLTGITIDLDAPNMSLAALKFLEEEILKPAQATKELLQKTQGKAELTSKISSLSEAVKFKMKKLNGEEANTEIYKQKIKVADQFKRLILN